MPRRAFTLLELLVTASIISMLTAISVPALQKARVSQRRVSCASQVRGLGFAAAFYAQDNNSWLPPGPREIAMGGPWAADPDRGSPLMLFEASRITTPGFSSQNGWYGQGLLWQQRALTQPKLYYCPEAQTLGWGFANAWPQHMAVAPEQAGEMALVSSSYIYRGGYASAGGTVNGPLNTTRNASGEPTFADDPLLGTMWHKRGYNIGYLDGHVEFRTFATAPVPGVTFAPLWDAAAESAGP